MGRHYAFQSGYIGTQWLNAGEVMETDENGNVVSISPIAQVGSEQAQEALPETPEDVSGGAIEPLPEIEETSTPDNAGNTKSTKRKA